MSVAGNRPEKCRYSDMTIKSALYGGFIIVANRIDYGTPSSFAPLFAGPLADCLAFMGAELGKPTDVEPFRSPMSLVDRIRAADNCGA